MYPSEHARARFARSRRIISAILAEACRTARTARTARTTMLRYLSADRAHAHDTLDTRGAPRAQQRSYRRHLMNIRATRDALHTHYAQYLHTIIWDPSLLYDAGVWQRPHRGACAQECGLEYTGNMHVIFDGITFDTSYAHRALLFAYTHTRQSATARRDPTYSIRFDACLAHASCTRHASCRSKCARMCDGRCARGIRHRASARMCVCVCVLTHGGR